MKTFQQLFYGLFLIIFIQCSQQKNSINLSWPGVQPENKPGTYWWWMGSAVDKQNLNYNLKSLSEAGIGNVHIIPIYGVKGEEDKYINFLSPEWMDMLACTVEEAKKLHMNVDMSTTTGWPFGGSHVHSEDAASKIEYKVFKLSTGEKIHESIDPLNLKALMAYSINKNPLNLIEKLDSSGTLNWTDPDNAWDVYPVWQKGTGQLVKRAAPGNVGLVLDPFSTTALKHYLTRYNNAFENYNGGKLRAQYHDSYEYYNANWTNDFFEKFKSINKYELRNYLPSILDPNKNNPYIKADYRRTLAILHLEYIENWTVWSHAKGWLSRNEAHGAPGNLLDLYAASDIPETETFGSRKFKIPGIRYKEENNSTSTPPNPLILKFASSAAHVTGKPLIASETGTWLRNHYKAALSQVKPEIDELFISGINHIFYHGNAYSPKDAEWPGWIFYASTHFEKENAFWHDFPKLNAYVTRCQTILQSGNPANDILLYWPVEDIYHSFPELLTKGLNVHEIDWFQESAFGKLAEELEKNGYSFDYISDQQIQNLQLKNSLLNTSGNSYKILMIPKTSHLPLNTLRQLKDLAEDGAVIIMMDSLPKDVPGFHKLNFRRSELKKSLSSLNFKALNENDLQKAQTGEGYFLLSQDINSALEYAGIKKEELVSKGLNYIRRKHDKGYYYFLTNLSDKKIDSWITLSVKFKSAVIFDPLYENRIGVATSRENNKNTDIYIQLQPGESCFIKTFTFQKINGDEWKYRSPAGEPIELKGEWQVDFPDGGPQIPASFSTRKLQSWTMLGDSATKSFAGTGKYTILFNLPNIVADDWRLDLGKVCESAKIRLNGKEVGTLWSFPFNTLVGKYLKQGENKLEIEVTNLSANRIRDLDQRKVTWKKFFFVNIFYKKFDASQWPVMDSGLLGPVTLIPEKIFLINKR